MGTVQSACGDVVDLISTHRVAVATGLVGLGTWTAWYDNYRCNKPEYKAELVGRRRSELIEKRKRNPHYYIKSIPLCEKPHDPAINHQYLMTQMLQGERLLQTGQEEEVRNGCAHIAMGLAYLHPLQAQQTLRKMAQALPQQLVQRIAFEYLPLAQGRVQRAMQSMTQSKKTEEPVIKEIEVHEQTDEPVDCDSIDGDDTISVGDVDELCNVDLPIEHENVDCELVELPVSIIDNNESLGLRIAELSTIAKPNIAQEAGIAAGDA